MGSAKIGLFSVSSRGQLHVDWGQLRWMSRQKGAAQMWQIPRRAFVEMALADPRQLGPVQPFLAVHLVDVTESVLRSLSRQQLATMAQVWSVPHSGSKEQLITSLLRYARVMKALDGHTAASLQIRYKRVELAEIQAAVGRGRYGNKAVKAAVLLGWSEHARRQRIRHLAEARHAADVRRALRAGYQVPDDVLRDYRA